MMDVIIIGAGVIGSSIARELSRYQLDICVLDKEPDVCCGTSKANSGIVHAGHDAKPGTLKARLNVLGNQMMEETARELDIPFKRNGSIVLCFSESEAGRLEVLKKQGEQNGVKGLRVVTGSEMKEIEPNISDKVLAFLYAPTGGIVCPFELTAAMAENAFANGAAFYFNTQVKEIKKMGNGYRVATDNGDFEAKLVINAAGVNADLFNNMVSSKKLTIVPRKGEYCLLDKKAGDFVNTTVFQLPTNLGKGVLITPTVHGNLMIGPTAENIIDREDTATTAEGIAQVIDKALKSSEKVPVRQVITSFAGLRAHERERDFVIGEAEDAPGFINAAGIDSPGLTSAPAIGVMVSEMAAKILKAEKKTDFQAERKGIRFIRDMDIEEANAKIAANPAYGRVVCRCETITEGEILDAIHRPLGAQTLDGVKRRTRAGMGRCQAGFCSPRVMEILARELNIPQEEICKSGQGSNLIADSKREG
ncbi:MAG: NAD(P)/FAD-dependent oxidoreductase [Clostridiales bacterium]|nr:NAD(P)/FAD-dependent oxidoreductase [Clostridiales bacterium]MDU3241727.1 NAD(P)/FAD-dependent oxidoreductase [Clostridiales bacterium]